MPMTRSFPCGVILAAILLATAGCGRDQDAADAPAPAPPPATAVPAGSDASVPAAQTSAPPGVLVAYVWDCDDGSSIPMQNLLAERAVVLELPGGSRRLPQVIAGSGVKYDDGSVSFWTKGSTAMLQRAGGPVVSCTESRPKSLLADARARGVAYRGVGNEPGWVLEIIPPDRLVFLTGHGQERHEFGGAAVSGDAESGADYRAQRDDESIRALLTLEPCRDDMAGIQFDYSMVVEFGGRTYRGCADATR